MLAKKSEVIKESIVTIKQLTADEKMKMQMEARERYHRDLVSAEDFGMAKGMKAFVESCQELDVSYEKTLDKFMEKFELSKDEAEEAIKNYWKS